MSFSKAALRATGLCALLTSALGAVPASATLLPQSWNGWRWARTGQLKIQVGNNVSAAWTPYLQASAATWSKTPNIDYIMTAGKSTGTGCRASIGTVQVCNGNYGANGWLGYTTVWTSGGSIVQATIQFNDYYFQQARYNNTAFRTYIACQEMGNALGLQDSDRIYNNANTGSCMDYTSDASGKLGINGPLANTAPSASDFKNLAAIYATLDKTQLAQTKATGVYGNAFAAPAPEPASWLTMIAGFGVIGGALRRRKQTAPATAAC
jgi:hypothetical protein